ncbi:MAG: hypothetical protein ACR2HR_02810 [Euzebya sp.]
MADDQLLAAYLNDHLAGSMAGRELASACAAENEGTDLGAFLSDLHLQIKQDQSTLQDIMSRLGVATDPLKEVGGWVLQKMGSLRFSTSLTGSAHLSNLMQLETLAMGIQGKLCLWQALRDRTDVASELDGIDLADLVDRAERQLRELQEPRLNQAAHALSDSGS